MDIGYYAQISAFVLFSFIAIAGGLGMATTMSMFRSGIFLMASFIGVAGLFILLMADLLGMLQIMMYIGGMLVMILFMVLFSHDPGGLMMTSQMQLSGLEKIFSLGLVHGKKGNGGKGEDTEDGGHEGHKQNEGHEGHEGHESRQGHGGDEGHGGHQKHGGQEDHQGHEGHSGMDMSMFTPIKKPAALLATLTGLLLVSAMFLRPAWPIRDQLPDQDSPRQIGQLLMGKYMVAFEGAGMLILLGIFGAVYLARVRHESDRQDRSLIEAASAEKPPRIQEEAPAPVYSSGGKPATEHLPGGHEHHSHKPAPSHLKEES